jgi:peptide/nickel transport system permease protein
MGGVIVLLIFVAMAITAPLLATVKDPSGTLEPNIGTRINPLPPSFSPSPITGVVPPFGTDAKGQDVYSLTLFGARASIEVGLAATMISILLGTLIGLGAGYFGRIVGEVLMRTTDFFLVLPWFPLMIVMMAILGRKFLIVILVIGITSWPSTARVVRAQVLTVKERQFIVRARAIGAGDGHIIATHILPNVLPLIFANTVLLIANAIFSEAFLDFFGLGDPRIISWGSMLEAAYEQSAFLRNAWWWIAAPGISIVAIVLAFSLVGYAIDDVMNPKLRKR